MTTRSNRGSNSTSITKKVVTLDDIWKSLVTIQESVSSHDKKLETIVKNIEVFEISLKSFSTAIDNLTTELNLVKEEKASLAIEVKSLHEKVSKLESKHHCGPATHEHNIFQESLERMSKANNFMIFNVPSSANENSETLNVMVDDLFQDLAIQCPYTSVKRIGPVGSRPRPIVVQLNSQTNVHMVLKSKRKLRNFERWKNIWINEDLTLMQRKQLSGLRSELKRLHDSGDHGWVIRNSYGSPKLVRTNPGQSTTENTKN